MNINFSIFFAIPLFLMIFHQIINFNDLINLNNNKTISLTIKIIFRINFEINWTFYWVKKFIFKWIFILFNINWYFSLNQPLPSIHWWGNFKCSWIILNNYRGLHHCFLIIFYQFRCNKYYRLYLFHHQGHFFVAI